VQVELNLYICITVLQTMKKTTPIILIIGIILAALHPLDTHAYPSSSSQLDDFWSFVENLLPHYPLYKYGNRVGKQRIAVYGLEFEDFKLPVNWVEYVKYRLNKTIEFWRNVTGVDLFEYRILGKVYIPYSFAAIAVNSEITQEILADWVKENIPKTPEYKEAWRKGYTAVMYVLPFATPPGGTKDVERRVLFRVITDGTAITVYTPQKWKGVIVDFSPFTLVWSDKPPVIFLGVADHWGFYAHELSHLIGFMTSHGKGPSPTTTTGCVGAVELSKEKLGMMYYFILATNHFTLLYNYPFGLLSYNVNMSDRVGRRCFEYLGKKHCEEYTPECCVEVSMTQYQGDCPKIRVFGGYVSGRVSYIQNTTFSISMFFRDEWREHEASNYYTELRLTFNVTFEYLWTPSGEIVVNFTLTDYRINITESELILDMATDSEKRITPFKPGTVLVAENNTVELPVLFGNRTGVLRIVFKNKILVNQKPFYWNLDIKGSNAAPYESDYLKKPIADVYLVAPWNKTYYAAPIVMLVYPVLETVCRNAPQRPNLLETLALKYAVNPDISVEVLDARKMEWETAKVGNMTVKRLRVKLYPVGHPKQTMLLLGYTRTKKLLNVEGVDTDESVAVSWIEVRSPEYDPVVEPVAVRITETVYFRNGRIVYVEMGGTTKVPVHVVKRDSDGGYWVEVFSGADYKKLPPEIAKTNVIVVAPEGWRPIVFRYVWGDNYTQTIVSYPLWRKGRIYGYYTPTGVWDTPRNVFVNLESLENSTVIIDAAGKRRYLLKNSLVSIYAFIQSKDNGEEKLAEYLYNISISSERMTQGSLPEGNYVLVVFLEPKPRDPRCFELLEYNWSTWRAAVELKTPSGENVPPEGWWWVVTPLITLNWITTPEQWIPEVKWYGLVYEGTDTVFGDKCPDVFFYWSRAAVEVYSLIRENYTIYAVYNVPIPAYGPDKPLLEFLRKAGVKMVAVNITRSDWNKTITVPVKVVRIKIPKNMLKINNQKIIECAVVYVPKKAPVINFTFTTVNLIDLTVDDEYVSKYFNNSPVASNVTLVIRDSPLVTLYTMYASSPDYYWFEGYSKEAILRDWRFFWYWSSFLDTSGWKNETKAGYELYWLRRTWNKSHEFPYGETRSTYGIRLITYFANLGVYRFNWSYSKGYSIRVLAGFDKLHSDWVKVVEGVLKNWSCGGEKVVPFHVPCRVVEEDNETVTLEVLLWTGGFEDGTIYVGRVVNATGVMVTGMLREPSSESLVVTYATWITVFYPTEVCMEVYASAPVSAKEIVVSGDKSEVKVIEVSRLINIKEKYIYLQEQEEESSETETEVIESTPTDLSLFIEIIAVFLGLLQLIIIVLIITAIISRLIKRKPRQVKETTSETVRSQ